MPTAADLAVNDNGTVTLTVTALDNDGIPTTWPSAAPAPTGGEVDPAGFTGPFFIFAAAVALANGKGFTLGGSVNQAAIQALGSNPLPTGIQLTATVASGFPNQTAPESENAEPLVDIVAGPANSFVAAVSEP